MSSKSLSFLLFGEDVTASKAFQKVAASAESTSMKVESASKRMGGGMLGTLGAAGFAIAGASMLKMAGDFQQSTNVLVTAAGESTKNLALIRNGILDIARTTGTSWQQVTDGMYVLEKAGYRGADALKVEKAAAEGAREEGAQLGTVTNALTSIMASYHLKAADAVTVTNEMKTAAGESKTTFENFAGSLSTVLPLASANKISFADVAGSLASLTQHGTSADEATQELANTIRNLSAPNGVAIKEMWQLGISSIDVQENLGKRGLAGTLEYLSSVVHSKVGPDGTLLLSVLNASKAAAADATIMFNKLGPAAKELAKGYINGSLAAGDYVKAIKDLPGAQNVLARQFKTTEDNARGFQQQLRNGLPLNQTATDALKKMTGGANGLNTTLQLTGESTKGTNERIARIAESAKAAGTDVQGWASTQKLFNVQLDMFKQSAEAVGIELGTKLLPVMSGVAGWMAKNKGLTIGMIAGFAGIKLAVTGVKIAMDVASAAAVAWGVAVDTLETLYIGAMLTMGEAAGPVGFALSAITVAVGIATKGFGLFGDSAHSQVKPVQELTDAINQDGDAVGKLTTANINHTLSMNGTYDAGLKLGISQSQVLAATLGNVNAQNAIKAALDRARASYDQATQHTATYGSASRAGSFATKQATQAQIDAKNAADKLSGSIFGLNGQLRASKNAADNEAAALAGLPGSSNAAKIAVTALQKALSKIPDHVGVTIDVNSSNAIAALQGFVNEAGAAQAAAQKVGSVVYLPAPPAPKGGRPHASGGYLDPGWNLVGDQGPELVHNGGSRNSRVMTASETRRIGGGSPIIGHLTVNAGMGTDGRAVGRQIVNVLEQHFGSGGRGNFRGVTV